MVKSILIILSFFTASKSMAQEGTPFIANINAGFGLPAQKNKSQSSPLNNVFEEVNIGLKSNATHPFMFTIGFNMNTQKFNYPMVGYSIKQQNNNQVFSLNLIKVFNIKKISIGISNKLILGNRKTKYTSSTTSNESMINKSSLYSFTSLSTGPFINYRFTKNFIASLSTDFFAFYEFQKFNLPLKYKISMGYYINYNNAVIQMPKSRKGLI